MSQKSAIQAFLNANPPNHSAWAPEAVASAHQLNRLLETANRVFGSPSCRLDVFDSLSAHDGIVLPAVRISFPNEARLEFFDNLSVYSVSIKSPACDVPEQFLKAAYHHEIDWGSVYRPGMPQSMAGKSWLQNPREFTFKTYDRSFDDLDRLVTAFSWLQKQSMGLMVPVAQAQQLPAAECRQPAPNLTV